MTLSLLISACLSVCLVALFCLLWFHLFFSFGSKEGDSPQQEWQKEGSRIRLCSADRIRLCPRLTFATEPMGTAPLRLLQAMPIPSVNGSQKHPFAIDTFQPSIDIVGFLNPLLRRYHQDKLQHLMEQATEKGEAAAPRSKPSSGKSAR